MDGKRIAALRKARGLEQEELADLLNIHVTTLSRWETGRMEPKVSAIKGLCEALHVTESELLNGPSNDTWELKLVFRKGDKAEGGLIDMSGNTISAALAIGDSAMSVELGAPFEVWEDDTKFEGLIEQLRAKRAAGLKARKEGW